MRQLITNDAFTMSRIMKKLNVEIKGQTDEEIGMELLLQIVENAHMAQSEINEFFGGLVEISGEEFGKMPITQSLEIIKQFKGLDGISDFFKLVGLLTK